MVSILGLRKYFPRHIAAKHGTNVSRTGRAVILGHPARGHVKVARSNSQCVRIRLFASVTLLRSSSFLQVGGGAGGLAATNAKRRRHTTGKRGVTKSRYAISAFRPIAARQSVARPYAGDYRHRVVHPLRVARISRTCSSALFYP